MEGNGSFKPLLIIFILLQAGASFQKYIFTTTDSLQKLYSPGFVLSSYPERDID
jgi:hypothetical protein